MTTVLSEGILVIDLGGTLADFHKISIAALNYLKSGRERIEAQTIIRVGEQYRSYKFSYLFLNQQAVAELFPESSKPKGLLDEYRTCVLKSIASIPRVRALFEILSKHCDTILIATNGTTEATFAILEAFDLKDLIPSDNLYISEQYGCLKERGTIHRAIRQRFPDQLIWSVGDSVRQDLIPSAKENMTPIWVTEFCAADELTQIPPSTTIVIPSIQILPSLLGILDYSATEPL